MNESPKVTAEKARDTYRKTATQFEELAGDTEVPEAIRALVEKNISQTRELYERSKDALEGVLESWERSFDAAGQRRCSAQPEGHRHCSAQYQFRLRSREEPGWGEEPC